MLLLASCMLLLMFGEYSNLSYYKIYSWGVSGYPEPLFFKRLTFIGGKINGL